MAHRTLPTVAAAVVALLASLAMPSALAAAQHWVLSSTWTPEACALQGRHQDAGPCVPARGMLVRGLWPYDATGYRLDCEAAETPDAGLLDQARTLLPGEGVVETLWRERGSCSELSPEAYFRTLQQAADQVRWPESFMRARANLRISKSHFEKALIEANPELSPESIAIECYSHYLTEVRLCLDPSLQPTACGGQVGDICPRELIIRPQ